MKIKTSVPQIFGKYSRTFKAIGLTSVFSLFVGCGGAQVKIAPDLEEVNPQAIAVLPVVAKNGVRQERLDFLRAELITELQGRGYLVLDDQIVSRLCGSGGGTGECSKKEALAKNYPIQGFIQLNIKSDAEVNFLAGFYNQLNGTLFLQDVTGSELASVTHTQSEKGGLLFNSGQVFEGLKSQYRNFGDNSFNALAERFVQTVVQKLPAPKSNSSAVDNYSVNVENVAVREMRPGVFEICAQGQDKNLASLIVNKQRSSLRRVSEGRFCGVYRFENRLSGSVPLYVELRSPFGTSARENVQVASTATCDLQGLVWQKPEGKSNRIFVSCSRDSVVDQASCSGQAEQVVTCSPRKFIFYKAPSDIGPYEKVGESQNRAFIDRRVDSAMSSIYTVIAVNQSGDISTPVVANIVK